MNNTNVMNGDNILSFERAEKVLTMRDMTVVA